MSAFIDTSKIAVTEGKNTIWVKRKMDFGTQCRVSDTLTRMAIKDGQTGDLQFTLGAQRLAMAVHNIVGWEGPDFDGQPCTPQNIERLDPAYPLFVKARERIAELNGDTDDADPNATTPGADG